MIRSILEIDAADAMIAADAILAEEALLHIRAIHGEVQVMAPDAFLDIRAMRALRNPVEIDRIIGIELIIPIHAILRFLPSDRQVAIPVIARVVREFAILSILCDE